MPQPTENLLAKCLVKKNADLSEIKLKKKKTTKT